MKKEASYKAIYLTFGILVICLAIASYAIAQWTEPTSTPPGDNVSTPLNVSNVGQSKAGGLILNTGGATNGLIVDQGNVGIGTTEPSEKLDVDGQIHATDDICTDLNEGVCLSDFEARCDIIRPYNPAEGDGYLGKEIISIPEYCIGGEPCNIVVKLFLSGSVKFISLNTYFQDVSNYWGVVGYANNVASALNGDVFATAIATYNNQIALYDDYPENENDADKWVYTDNSATYSGELIACKF